MILYSIQAFLTFSIVDGFMSDKYEKIYKDQVYRQATDALVSKDGEMLVKTNKIR